MRRGRSRSPRRAAAKKERKEEEEEDAKELILEGEDLLEQDAVEAGRWSAAPRVGTTLVLLVGAPTLLACLAHWRAHGATPLLVVLVSIVVSCVLILVSCSLCPCVLCFVC
jgi:hypothetical protein